MRNVWEKWKVVSKKVGDFQATVIFSFLYFLLLAPLGIISSLFHDFLQSKSKPYWSRIEKNSTTLRGLRKQ